MTIGKRLIVLLAVPLVALLVFGILAGCGCQRSRSAAGSSRKTQLASVAALGGISASFAELRVSVRALLLAADAM